MTVKVIVKDKEGKEIWSFNPTNRANFQEMAALQGIEIPVACGVGVCGICLCEVEEGNSMVQEDLYGNPAQPLPEDENGAPQEILACVAGIKEGEKDLFADEEEHVIVLKRAY